MQNQAPEILSECVGMIYLPTEDPVCVCVCAVVRQALMQNQAPEILSECVGMIYLPTEDPVCVCVCAVVRQALMQNQAPEIQAKLLAMQRQIQQQQHVITAPQAVLAKSLLTSPVKPHISTPVTPIAVDMSRSKKPLTQDQKDDQMRWVVLLCRLYKRERERENSIYSIFFFKSIGVAGMLCVCESAGLLM